MKTKSQKGVPNQLEDLALKMSFSNVWLGLDWLSEMENR